MITQSKYLTPIAIVVAGILIAGAIFVRSQENEIPNNQNTENEYFTFQMRDVGSDDHILGSIDAPIKLIEYSDTECPFCKTFHQTLHQVVEKYADQNRVAWIYRHFPIDQLHRNARTQAEATECAYEQGGNEGFWNYIDKIYETTTSNDGLDLDRLDDLAVEVDLDGDLLNQCLKSGKYKDKVQEDVEDAQLAGASGTPYSVILLPDQMSEETFAVLESIKAQLPPGGLRISEDRTTIGISGALAPEFFEFIIESESSTE